MKKGFTLIELLGVIILLGVLALIVYPIIDKAIKNSREKAYQQQINSILDAAKIYIEQENIKQSSLVQTVTLNSLKDKGYLENKIIYNPIDNSEINGCVLYFWNNEGGQFQFEYSEDCERTTFASCFDFDSNTQTITGYDTSCGNIIIIPSKINGYKVKHIGDGAFSEKRFITNLKSDVYAEYLMVDEKDCAKGCYYIVPYNVFVSENIESIALDYHVFNAYYNKNNINKFCVTKEGTQEVVEIDKIYDINDGYVYCEYDALYSDIRDYCMDNRSDILCLRNYRFGYLSDNMNSNLKYVSSLNKNQDAVMKIMRDYEDTMPRGSIERVDLKNAIYLETIGISAFAFNKIRTVEFGDRSLVTKIDVLSFAGNDIVNIDFENLKQLISIGAYAFIGNVFEDVNLSNSTQLQYIGQESFCTRYNDCGGNISFHFPKDSIWTEPEAIYRYDIVCHCE